MAHVSHTVILISLRLRSTGQHNVLRGISNACCLCVRAHESTLHKCSTWRWSAKEVFLISCLVHPTNLCHLQLTTRTNASSYIHRCRLTSPPPHVFLPVLVTFTLCTQRYSCIHFFHPPLCDRTHIHTHALHLFLHHQHLSRPPLCSVTNGSAEWMSPSFAPT